MLLIAVTPPSKHCCRPRQDHVACQCLHSSNLPRVLTGYLESLRYAEQMCSYELVSSLLPNGNLRRTAASQKYCYAGTASKRLRNY
ncbi:uncharacterized protein FPOAC1_013038 [Fusarium poae]|uniref:uncharacterized protein n=1 Tax=Fusarium poae TaxID=36050 RepID=UPI001D04D5F3|nr:uncharacterized protein FPOAC1_013038 [Fusarium poae]KAG8665060.1 hypothetical protein FPOAC1_013038 [Fusarium poae]